MVFISQPWKIVRNVKGMGLKQKKKVVRVALRHGDRHNSRTHNLLELLNKDKLTGKKP